MENNKYIKIVREPSEWFKNNTMWYNYRSGTLELVSPAGTHFCDWSRDKGIKEIVWFIPNGHVVDDDLLEAMKLNMVMAGEGNIGKEHTIICWSHIYKTAAEAGETYIRDDEGYHTCVYIGEEALTGALWVKREEPLMD